MRQKRAKTYKRVMALYSQTFNFRPPFQILVADDFLLVPAVQQLDVYKQLANSVQGEIKPMITQCCMQSLYAAGPSIQRTTNLAKTFERRHCNHRTALPSDECLAEMVGETNKHRYILATQSAALLELGARIAALPVIHFNARGVVVLSPLSTASVREKHKGEEERRVAGKKQMEGLVEGPNVLREREGESGGAGPSRVKGRTGNPNPLSMKKKKKQKAPAGRSGDVKEKDQGAATKRRRDAEGDGDDDEVKVREGDEPLGGADDALDEGRNKRKKKRKRRGKGEVAQAIEELNTHGELLDAAAPEAGGASGGGDSDSD